MLKDAVQAIYNKVQTDLSSASPEELAYLSTSLEKLGGRATVYDVMDVGEDKKAEIQQIADDAIASINTSTSDAQSQFESDIAQIVSDAETTLNGLVSTGTTSINSAVQVAIDVVQNAIDGFDAPKAAAIQEIQDASDALSDVAAVANQQAINGSRFNLMAYSALFK